MITARYMEIRSRKLPGQPTETIVRTVDSRNGHGRKTVRVLRNGKTVSAVTEPLTPIERSNIQIRKFTPNLYVSPERKTLRKLKTTQKRKARKPAKKAHRHH